MPAVRVSRLQELTAAGARLTLGSPSALASQLCALVKAGNEDVLRRYLAAGADVNAADYVRRLAVGVWPAAAWMLVLAVIMGGLVAADGRGAPLAAARVCRLVWVLTP
jgi:hypothetical protein